MAPSENGGNIFDENERAGDFIVRVGLIYAIFGAKRMALLQESVAVEQLALLLKA